MKSFNIIALSTISILCLVSCEMKNELTGSLVNKDDTGMLELAINVKQPVSQTRTDGESTVSTDNFPVIIQGTSSEVANVTREYAAVTEVPTSIEIPVGQYTITSHTPGELEKQMSSPYYSGNTEITVTKDITSEVNVECRMANSRVQVKYGDDFKAAFSEWTITVDDGNEMCMTFTQNDIDAAPVYWHFAEDATAITVNIRATTTTGNTVRDKRVFKKSDAAEKYEEEGDVFTGGDAVEIAMGTVESSTGEVTGITITTNITFEDSEESVEIPTIDPNVPSEPEKPEEPGEDDGEEGETGAITLNLPEDVTYSISAGNAPAKADAYIASEVGLDKIIVTITSGNSAFQEIIKDLVMDEQSFLAENGGVDLIDNTDFGELLASSVEGQAPTDGIKEYIFPIGAFFTFLNVTGATDEGKSHEFHITVTNKNGETANGVYKVTITE